MLTMRNVFYTYQTKKRRVDALKNVTCGFDAGVLYAIEGPSGSGKSTLLSLLAAQDCPNAGQILYDGVDISTLDPDEYRSKKISMVFQAFNLLPFMTALENVAYPAILQKKGREEARMAAARYLSMTGIDESYHHAMPHTLSGGEQQRVAIARALCSEAQIILADEPTGNLDSENAAMIMDTLARLSHQENRCVIVVTHDLDMAARADQRLVIKDGMLEQPGKGSGQ